MELAAMCFMVCLTALTGLALVLRHLASMRVTSGEVAALDARIALAISAVTDAYKRLQADVDNEKQKLIQLSNRTR